MHLVEREGPPANIYQLSQTVSECNPPMYAVVTRFSTLWPVSLLLYTY